MKTAACWLHVVQAKFMRRQLTAFSFSAAFVTVVITLTIILYSLGHIDMLRLSDCNHCVHMCSAPPVKVVSEIR